jgi:hypothetical protein
VSGEIDIDANNANALSADVLIYNVVSAQQVHDIPPVLLQVQVSAGFDTGPF